VRYQVAQKLHACTELPTDGRSNDRFRDLIDLLLLAELLEDDEWSGVREACEELFALREMHAWPPVVTVFGGWPESYRALAVEVAFHVTGAQAAAVRVQELIGRIARVGQEVTLGTVPQIRQLTDRAVHLRPLRDCRVLVQESDINLDGHPSGLGQLVLAVRAEDRLTAEDKNVGVASDPAGSAQDVGKFGAAHRPTPARRGGQPTGPETPAGAAARSTPR